MRPALCEQSWNKQGLDSRATQALSSRRNKPRPSSCAARAPGPHPVVEIFATQVHRRPPLRYNYRI